MHNEIFNLIRITLLGILLIAFVACSAAEMETWEEDQQPAPAEAVEAAPAAIMTRQAPASPTPTPTPTPEPEPEEEWTSLGTFDLTAYCSCETCCGYWATVRPHDENGNPIVYTASGAIAEAGTTIAVDPNIIPYGTTVKIDDHIYIAQDTGGAIKGNRVDVYHDDHKTARAFEVRDAEVFVKEE